MERVYGKFERSIRLPMPVKAGRVSVTYRDGVFEVRLPRIKIDVS
jgi:HSP20 family molecular chaperone IbpA